MEQNTSDWQPAGRIRFLDNALTLPDIPPRPGLYRLRFDSGAIYIGEANSLQRRLGDYLVYYESTGIESEFRINKRLKDEHGANVEIMLDDSFASKSARCIREHIEIKKSGSSVINGGTIPDRIAFYRTEIERLEKLLAHSVANHEVFDLDELMHQELLQNEHANAMADELARSAARELGFGEDMIAMIGRSGASDPRQLMTSEETSPALRAGEENK